MFVIIHVKVKLLQLAVYVKTDMCDNVISAEAYYDGAV